jgi:hypothetical protein
MEHDLFDILTGEDQEEKKRASQLAASGKISSAAFLSACQKITDSKKVGWGRAKRNFALSWYLKRPIESVKREVDATPQSGGFSHKDLCKYLNITRFKMTKEQKAFFKSLCSEDDLKGSSSWVSKMKKILNNVSSM